MGFLSKLWKGVKSVFTGITKIFSPILKPLGKILGTGWGKALMLAASVFTFGAALLTGVGQVGTSLAAGQGFLQSFVEGGKAFVGSLLGTGSDKAAEGVKGLAEGGTAGLNEAALTEGAVTSGLNPMALNQSVEAGASNINAAGNLVSGGSLATEGVAGGAAGGGGALSQAADLAGDTSLLMSKGGGLGPTNAMAEAGKSLAKEESGNWLSKAANKAWDFVKSDSGQNLIGSALEGYGAGERDQAFIDHRERYDRMWRDPKETQRIRDLSENFAPDVPDRWNRDPAALARRRIDDYVPSVPYTRSGS